MLQLVSKKKFFSGRKSKYGYYYVYSVWADGSKHYIKSFRSLSYAKKYISCRIENLISKYPVVDFSNVIYMLAYRYPGFDNDSNEYEYYFKYVKESEV